MIVGGDDDWCAGTAHAEGRRAWAAVEGGGWYAERICYCACPRFFFSMYRTEAKPPKKTTTLAGGREHDDDGRLRRWRWGAGRPARVKRVRCPHLPGAISSGPRRCRPRGCRPRGCRARGRRPRGRRPLRYPSFKKSLPNLNTGCTSVPHILNVHVFDISYSVFHAFIRVPPPICM